MEFFFFIILAIIIYGVFGDGKKQKAKLGSRSVLSPKAISGASGRADESYPRDWKNYEAAEQGEQGGMQEDLEFSTLYKMSKERVNRAQKLARKAAEAKLIYKGLPTTKGASKSSESLQNFETTAKNKQASGAYVAKQPPLVRDMNLSRKLFLSGGRSNTFGERQKKSFGMNTILGVAGLAIIGLYMLGALGS